MKIKGRFCFTVVLMLALMILAGGTINAENSFPEQDVRESIDNALGYLHTMQNGDGGFTGRTGGESSRALTSWVVMALEAAGEDCAGDAWAPKGKNPVDFLINCQYPMETTADYARLLLALSAAGQGSGGRAQELSDQLSSLQQPDGWLGSLETGEEGMINVHFWSVLALASTGGEVPEKEKARNWLLARQNEDGGFGWAEGLESDADDTAIAIQSLVILGENPENSQSMQSALTYLQGNQREDGGFSAGEWMGRDSNMFSDAWVLQGLIAAGENPVGSGWTLNGHHAVSHILSLQNTDGSFNWKKGILAQPVTATAYAVTALTKRPFPINLEYAQIGEKGSNRGFSDLPQKHWAFDFISNLVEAGVLGGYPDSTFRPENPVTRAEFTKFIALGLGFTGTDSSKADRFPDVPESHWARSFISAAVDQGFIQGSPDGIFGLNRQITGAELSAILVRALPEAKNSALQDGAKWYSGYVQLAENEGLLYPDFQPAAGATRAQCAFSISRLQALLGQ